MQDIATVQNNGRYKVHNQLTDFLKSFFIPDDLQQIQHFSFQYYIYNILSVSMCNS